MRKITIILACITVPAIASAQNYQGQQWNPGYNTLNPRGNPVPGYWQQNQGDYETQRDLNGHQRTCWHNYAGTVDNQVCN